MNHGVFFDETRSWRYPAIYVFFVGTTLLGSVGGWLLVHAIMDERASWGARLFIGGVFGAGFLLLFGTCALILLWRLLQPPCRVLIDRQGVQFGATRLDWTEVRCLSFRITAGAAWLTIRSDIPGRRRFLVPGKGLPPDTWPRVVEQLQRHFLQSGLNVEIEIIGG